MKVYGAVLDGIDGKLIEVDSDINPELKKSIKIMGVKGVVIRDAAEAVLRVLPSTLPDSVEAKGLVTIDLIPREGGSRSGDALALPIGVRAYLALILQQVPELPPPPKPGASDEDIEKYNELVKNLKAQASLRAKIMKHIGKDNSEYLLIGGIRLDGRLYVPERGLMGLISSAKDGMKVIVPSECAGYGYLAKLMLGKQGKSIHVMVAETFTDALHIIDGTISGQKVKETDLYKMRKYEMPSSDYHDFSEIIGQHKAKYALEIAAAGGHNVLLWGAKGEGKSTLANAIIGILPSIFKRRQTETFSALAEVNKIYTAKGLLGPNQFIDCRPFRRVSAKTGAPGLIGSGHNPQPGEISLAHCGVLMIDEFNFMDANTMEQLRVPLEDGYIDITRAKGSYRFPASFTLIATMNPCRCSYFGEYECYKCGKVVGDLDSKCSEHPDAKLKRRCTCTTSGDIRPFQNFSGPILNRIDLIVQTFSVDPHTPETRRESSEEVRNRVELAIKKQRDRYINSSQLRCNAEIKHKHIEQNIINMNASAKRAAQGIRQKHRLNMRSYVQLHAVARTIADLKDRDIMTEEDIIEAHKIMGRDRDVFNRPAGKVNET